MKMIKYALLVSALVSGFAFVGCKEKGPFEKAGEAVDKAAKETGDAAKEAGEKAKDAAKEATGK